MARGIEDRLDDVVVTGAAAEVPFERLADFLLRWRGVLLEVAVAGEDRRAHRRHAVVREFVDVQLSSLGLGLNLVGIDRTEDCVDLALQKRRHHRRDRHVDHRDIRLLEIVGLEKQRQHRRLRRCGRNTHLLSRQILHRLDAGLLKRHDRVRIRLIDRRDDLHRRALGDQLADRNCVGVRKLGASIGHQLRRIGGAVSLDNRHVESGVPVEAFRNGCLEAGIGSARHPVQLKRDRRARGDGAPCCKGESSRERCDDERLAEQMVHVTSYLDCGLSQLDARSHLLPGCFTDDETL